MLSFMNDRHDRLRDDGRPKSFAAAGKMVKGLLS